MACMLDRCHQIGDTAGFFARMREVAWQTEVAMRTQREAQHLARVRVLDSDITLWPTSASLPFILVRSSFKGLATLN